MIYNVTFKRVNCSDSGAYGGCRILVWVGFKNILLAEMKREK